MDAFQRDCVSDRIASGFKITNFTIISDLVHLSITRRDGAKKDFQSFVETFFRDDVAGDTVECDAKPTILFSSYFEIPSSAKGVDASESQSGPIYTCSGPFMELDYDESIRQTKLLYEKMYPGDEFLPKAPEPDEIIIGDEDATEGNVNLGALADLIDDKPSIDDKSSTETEVTEAESAETITEPAVQ